MMHCPKCHGFGFYTTIDATGKTSGVKCDHKKARNFVLIQDLDIHSSLSRTHDDAVITGA